MPFQSRTCRTVTAYMRAILCSVSPRCTWCRMADGPEARDPDVPGALAAPRRPAAGADGDGGVGVHDRSVTLLAVIDDQALARAQARARQAVPALKIRDRGAVL